MTPIAIVFLPSDCALAQTRIWNGSSSSWTTAANWSPAIVPFLTSDVEINGGISSLSAASGQSQDVYVGRTAGSDGTLHTLNVGQLRSRLVYLGDNATGSGGATVTGIGSKWTVDSGITIGRFGDGILGIAEQGELIVSSGISYLGREAGSLGIVHVDGSGSKWTGGSGSLVVGRAAVAVGQEGGGRLTILNGGQVTNGIATVGDLSNSVGDVLLNNFAIWNITNGTLVVGNNGKGTLDIQDHSEVTSFGGRVGLFAGADGVVIVDGEGSKWTMTGELEVGNGGGSGIVQILRLGYVQSVGGVVGGTATSNAEVRVDGSIWTNSSYLAVRSGGALILKNRSLVESTSGEIDGADIDLRGTVSIESESDWEINGNLTVGNNGYGKLTIADDETGGGFFGVRNTTATLGFGQNSDAEVVVRGADALWENTGRLTVGNAGDARLTIAEGGRVRSNTAIIADNVTSQSTVIVEGIGSRWEVTGTVAGGFGALLVGDTNGAGTEGTLVVRDGGFVKSSGPAPSPLSGDVHIQGKGKLMGNGKVIGIVYNAAGATVAPGYVHEITGDEVRGTLHITGDYRQGGGKLQIELGADAYDKLDVSGAFNLNFAVNILEVTLDEGFVPLIGQSFDILDWGSTNMHALAGPSFTPFLPALPGGRVWDLSLLHTDGVIAVGGTSTVAGDYNGNGTADAADYVVLRKSGTENDYNVWRGNFGSNGGAGAGQADAHSNPAVPEPGTLTLIILAVLGISARSRNFMSNP